MNWLLTLCRGLLGIIFALASLDKILDPVSFAGAVDHYNVLPEGLVPLAALVLPWTELLAGGCLILGLRARSAALLVAGMSGVFTLAVTSALVRGLDLGCGCFYPGMARLSWDHLLLDLALLGAALVILRYGPGRLALDAGS